LKNLKQPMEAIMKMKWLETELKIVIRMLNPRRIDASNRARIKAARDRLVALSDAAHNS
jgi:hypothetical protein